MGAGSPPRAGRFMKRNEPIAAPVGSRSGLSWSWPEMSLAGLIAL